METKDDLRSLFLNFRNNIKKEQVLEASIQIKNKFFQLKEVIDSEKFLIYHSYRNEVITHGMIKRLLMDRKTVYLPYCLKKTNQLGISKINNLDTDLIEGTYGIKEPKERAGLPITELDVVVVPGIAFTYDGFRLGYGGGYYDRFLARLPQKTLTIGLIYQSLLVESLPVGKHDRQVEIIITEEEVIRVGGDIN